MNAPSYHLRYAKACLDVAHDFPSHPMGPLINRILTAKTLPALDRSRGKRRGRRGRVVTVTTGNVRLSAPGELSAITRQLSQENYPERLITWHALQRASLHGKGSAK